MLSETLQQQSPQAWVFHLKKSVSSKFAEGDVGSAMRELATSLGLSPLNEAPTNSVTTALAGFIGYSFAIRDQQLPLRTMYGGINTHFHPTFFPSGRGGVVAGCPASWSPMGFVWAKTGRPADLSVPIRY